LYILQRLVYNIDFKSFKLLKYPALIEKDSNNFGGPLKEPKILKNFNIKNGSAAKKGIDLRDKDKLEGQLIMFNVKNIICSA
jgi:hypothetical protein